MLMGKAVTDLILLEWSPVKCDWAWLRHQNKNNDEEDEKYHEEEDDYEYERGNWMKMKMEKQFKVIKDENVWITEAWGSRGRKCIKDKFLIGKSGSINSLILINQKKN